VNAFFGFFISTTAGRIFGALILAVLAIYGTYHKGRLDGKYDERARVEQQIRKDAETARQIERDAAPCLSDPGCVLNDPFRMRGVRPDPGK
jgi:hypothetical protein